MVVKHGVTMGSGKLTWKLKIAFFLVKQKMVDFPLPDSFARE